ncbi:Imm1 family immunity protein [Promicromonospora soli]
MSWGAPEYGTTPLEIQDVESLRQAHDLAEVYADLMGGPLEVDLWDVELPLDRPLMVQFLVGHPTLSRVLVHNDGVGHYAVGDQPTGDGEEIRYARPSGTFTAEPETTITSAQARTILADFVRTGRVSVRVAWAELSMD